MLRTALTLLIAASAAMAQYKLEPAGPPPSDLPPAIAETLQKDGSKVVGGGGKVVCEIWFRSEAPSGGGSTEEGVDIPTIPYGAFLGVLRFTERGEDRRGQGVQPGLYTLRYSLHPVNGDHLGVAYQRDFVVLTPIADDKDVTAAVEEEPLMNMGRKASGTPHPAVMSIWRSRQDSIPSIQQDGDHDWVLHTKMGDLPLAIIVVGRAEG